ncbi:Na+/H+ antiporter subunit E [Wolbachia endosymbiont of Chironomus riparius]|uniref:Na+/H+ antiporter subunit E n=1 Tax=Wolbachia endosymbiont of Chironomus riparius TaxID=2883238 RepID=UPI00209F3A6D|nr:Na+/H+ antiporter subunit E [Wolbachia endosymbiont of Chironomus riparius]
MHSYNYRQEIKFLSLSLIVLFTLWVILSGRFDSFFFLCGIFSSAFTLYVFRRLINAQESLSCILSSKSKLSLCGLISYIPWLMYQMIISSIYVIKKILKFNLQLEPIIILREHQAHNDKSITLFANSVTITPGTLTINVETRQNMYLSTICLIDKDLKSGIVVIENKVLSDCFK